MQDWQINYNDFEKKHIWSLQPCIFTNIERQNKESKKIKTTDETMNHVKIYPFNIFSPLNWCIIPGDFYLEEVIVSHECSKFSSTLTSTASNTWNKYIQL